MPNGLPYPGSWIFAYPVARPTDFGAASPISSTQEIAASPSVAVQTPKFFPLKPVLPTSVQPVESSFTPSLTASVEEPAEDFQAASTATADKAPEPSGDDRPTVESIPEFAISPALVAEPQTNSIVIAPSDDPLKSEIFTDEGYFVRTGSIEIVPVQTGEIAVVSENVATDERDSADAAETQVSTIAPVSSSSVVNSKGKPDILPSGRRKVKDSSTTSLTLLISIVLVAALSITAYFFGLFG